MLRAWLRRLLNSYLRKIKILRANPLSTGNTDLGH
jgi:hypothetical protein